MEKRHDLTILLLALRSWGTLVVPKSTSGGCYFSVFEHKRRAQAKSLRGKGLSSLVLCGRSEHKQQSLSCELVQRKSRAQAPLPLPRLSTEHTRNTRLLTNLIDRRALTSRITLRFPCGTARSEEHTSELQSQSNLVC